MESSEANNFTNYHDKNNFPKLRDFAFLDTTEVYLKKLKYLETIAEKEVWTIDPERELDVLKFYLDNVFEQAYKMGKIEYSADLEYCCFNTGLLTDKFQSIIALFSKNTKAGAQEWFFLSFHIESNRSIFEKFSKIPELVKFYTKAHELFFDTDYPIIASIEHIIDDNFERFPQEVQDLGPNTVYQILKGSLDDAKKRIERNHLLVIPQFYKDKIMFLLPITMMVGYKSFTMALAVEEINKKYRANTIFTLDMAYSLARLVCRPETNWFLNK